MKIAILGWGSLLWEGGQEFDKRHDTPWRLDGPTLKIEFSRKSTSRQGALTLVIDDQHGSPTTVAWCLSTRQNVEDAICDLRCREGTAAKNIECALATEGQKPIAAWAGQRSVDAVIWTALKSNFGESFSVETAIAYVNTLDSCGKAKAAEYVRRAPVFVKTPLRDALQREPWFLTIPF